MSNAAEGFGRDSWAGCCRFLTIAKVSAGEVRSLLHVALNIGFIDRPMFVRLKDRADETPRVDAAFPPPSNADATT